MNMNELKGGETAKPLAVFAAMILLLSLLSLIVVLPNNKVEAQSAKEENLDAMNPQNWNEVDEIQVPAENIQLVETFEIGKSSERRVPSVADPASVYSATTGTFSGQAFAPGGQANTPAITRLLADDLTLVGTPPFSIGRFDFSMCNLNAATVSARPRVRFYLDNAGTPGTFITGFSFPPLTVNTGNCSTFNAVVDPFSVSSNNIWAGMVFDNLLATATAAQVDGFGMGIFPVPDLGTSADIFYLTTSAPTAGTSFLTRNPGPGATSNFAGMPVANFGWDFRVSASVSAITRMNPVTRPTTGTAQWSVTTTGGSITGLTPANFTLTGTATAGSTITSVSSDNFAPNSTSWTVTAAIGTTPGSLGLTWANITGLNTNVITLPFVGEVYTVTAPTASTAEVSGRITSSNGRGIARARVTVTNTDGTVRYTTTNSQGYYRFTGIQAGETYIFGVSSKSYQFTPSTQTIFLEDDFEGLNFVAQP